MSRIRRSTMMVALGGAVAYFLDPDNGEARRHDVSTRIQRLRGRSLPASSDGPNPFNDALGQEDGGAGTGDTDPTGGAAPAGPEGMQPTAGVAAGAPTPVVLP